MSKSFINAESAIKLVTWLQKGISVLVQQQHKSLYYSDIILSAQISK